jgi:hypothetical protein
MNVVADITLILVRPAVLDEMSAQAEKLGMTNLRRGELVPQNPTATRLPLRTRIVQDTVQYPGDRAVSTYTAVPQYMIILVQRYWSPVGRRAMTNHYDARSARRPRKAATATRRAWLPRGQGSSCAQ